MIEWLFETGLDITVLLGVVFLIRIPVRRILGAQVAYWLWTLPLIRLLFIEKPTVPLIINENPSFDGSESIVTVFMNPEIANISFLTVLYWVWLCGFFLWISWRVFQWLNLERSIKKLRQAVDLPAAVKNKISKITHRSIQFYSLELNVSPFVTGLFKPKVYLPHDFFQTFTPEQQIWVIRHEVSHIKKFDLWVQLMAEAITAIFWFNPVMHFAKRMLREDQELACDHYVLKRTPISIRADYGEALMKIYNTKPSPILLTFFNFKYERFIMLKKHKSTKKQTTYGLLLCFFIAGSGLILPRVSFAEKTPETHGNLVSYNFKDTPLTSVMVLVQEAMPEKNITGLEKIDNEKVSVKADNVYSYDFARSILLVNGYNIKETENTWEVVKQ